LIKRLLKFVFGLIILSVVLLLLAPVGVYFYGLQRIDYLDTPPQVAIDDELITSYLVWNGESDRSKYRILNPYSYIYSVVRFAYRLEPGKEEKQLDFNRDYQLADIRLYNKVVFDRWWSTVKKDPERARDSWLTQVTAIVSVSKRWTIEQIVADQLQGAYFGRGAYGLNSASQLYFGKPPLELNDNQRFALFHLEMAPQELDLWCFPEKHRTTATSNLNSRNVAHDFSDLQLLPAPEDACDFAKDGVEAN